MKRIGNSNFAPAVFALLCAVSTRAWAEIEFYQSVDRNEIGVEDAFRLTLVASDAPEHAQIQFPASPDFQVLSKSQSTQMSLQLGGAGSTFKRTQKYVLTLRANRVGTFTVPAAVLTVSGKTYKTEPVQMVVKPGRSQDPTSGLPKRRSPVPDPFQGFPFPDLPGFDNEEDLALPDFNMPRSDSDLLLRASVDRPEVFAGDQVTFSLYILSRVDLSGVDSVTLPKLDGFWSEDVESPTQLSGEQKIINGIPYRAYLLKRLALFPVRSGTLKIGTAEADVTTGFVFSGRRVHRVSNELEVNVKPLPPGAPRGFANGSVGKWKLWSEVSPAKVELGQPLTVKVILEGKGNLKNVALPALQGPAALRIYDPTTTDKLFPSRQKIGGRRVQEYLVMAQQTGTFTLPALSFPFFDPEKATYEETRTEPLTLTVVPSAGGTNTLARSAPSGAEDAPKNVLATRGPRPLRYQASFSREEAPLWRKGFFFPALFAPPGLWLALAVVGWARARLAHEDEASVKRRKARAARRRLAAAERLKRAGQPAEFYGEVEKALTGFLAAKLGVPVVGLTREALTRCMIESDLPESRRLQVVRVLDDCDLGRFAPWAADDERQRILEEAQALMESWGSR